VDVRGPVSLTIQSYLDLVKQRAPGIGQPVTHENGFIQLSVGEHARLHVWPDIKLQKQRTDSPLHDHTFSFRSWILLGALDNIHVQALPLAMELNSTPCYEIYQVTTRGALLPTDTFCIPRVLSHQHMVAGSVYEFLAGEFHESRWRGLSCSLMIKTKIMGRDDRAYARVLCHAGEDPDNEFDRASANPPELLWSIIDQAVMGAEHHLEELWGNG